MRNLKFQFAACCLLILERPDIDNTATRVQCRDRPWPSSSNSSKPRNGHPSIRNRHIAISIHWSSRNVRAMKEGSITSMLGLPG